MKLDISRADVWAVGLDDRPGAWAEKLDALVKAGANFEFGIARRTHEKPGSAVVFVTPIKGAKQQKAAAQAGFTKAESLHSVRILAPDKPGIGLQLARALADAGINLKGFSAAAVAKRAVFYIAFDSDADAKKAVKCLRQI